jgi:hypothetical protein
VTPDPVARVWLFEADDRRDAEVPPVDLGRPAGVMLAGNDCLYGVVSARYGARPVTLELGVRPTDHVRDRRPGRYYPPAAAFGLEIERPSPIWDPRQGEAPPTIGPDPHLWPESCLLGYLFMGRNSLFGRLSLPGVEPPLAVKIVIAGRLPGEAPWSGWAAH